MKIIIGTGNGEESGSALDFVAQMQFPKVAVELVYVVERLGKPVFHEGGPAKDLTERFSQLQEKEGRERLAWGRDRMQEYGIEPTLSLRAGFIANELLLRANESKADIIAIGSRDEAPLQKMLIGSVGRKLVSKTQQSLLVCRGSLRAKAPIDAVFATDHSEYANRCLDYFVSIAPRGIRKLTVMTAYPKSLVDSIKSVAENFKVPLDEWITQTLEQENAKVIRKLAPLGYDLKSKVLAGPVDESIHSTLSSTNSQLLILGAHGHGFVERMALGSISFNEVVAGQHSVLVLRV